MFVVSGTSGSYPWSVAVAAGSGSEAALAVADQFDGDTRQIRVTDRQISEIADALTAEGGLSGADLLSCRGLAAREIVAVADWAETRA